MGGLLGSEGHLNVTRISCLGRYAGFLKDLIRVSVNLQAGSVQHLGFLVFLG